MTKEFSKAALLAGSTVALTFQTLELSVKSAHLLLLHSCQRVIKPKTHLKQLLGVLPNGRQCLMVRASAYQAEVVVSQPDLVDLLVCQQAVFGFLRL